MRWLSVVPITVGLIALALPLRSAEACGGTFCDGGGPMVSPVDQAFETVLFVQDGAYVEAHIQIAIDPNTDALKFAWLVPMPAVPEFSVGSQPLFDAMLTSTAPSYSLSGDYCGGLDEGDGGSAFIARPDGGATGEPDVVFSDTVGAFDITVLQGGTVDGVMTWLGDNGYAQDPAAEPILGDYLAEGNVIVAFKLAPSATSAEVHPVVLRYLGSEPCVPIRLTAIAAQDDMGVRAFFLGDSRFAPTNYMHVVPNVLRFDWTYLADTYASVITMAVDEAAGGRGFVTEYAGTSDIVPPDGIWSGSWDAAPFVAADPTTVVDLLNAQGLADCTEFGPCIVPYPLVVAMLRKYLPAPMGVNENDFYACLSCHAGQIDQMAWNGPAFAAELDERVIAPGQHGVDLLGAWPYLSRLFTTISPPEMTVDPMFHSNPDLPDVPNVQTASATCTECGAMAHLPDGRDVYQPDSWAWPQFPAEMPWADRVEQIPPVGAPIVEVDNRATIDALLAEHNAASECGPGGTTGSSSVTDASASASTSQGSGVSVSGSASAGDGGTTSDDGGQDGGDDTVGRGCACGSGGTSVPWLLALAAPLLRRRTRGRRAATLGA